MFIDLLSNILSTINLFTFSFKLLSNPYNLNIGKLHRVIINQTRENRMMLSNIYPDQKLRDILQFNLG